MISILSIIKDKSIWLATLTIMTLFAITPYVIFDYSYPFCICFSLLILFFVATNKAGYSCIIFAYNQMLPLGDFHLKRGASSFYICYLCTLLCAVILLAVKKKKIDYNFSPLLKISAVMVCFAIIFAIKADLFTEVRDVSYYLISTVVFFYICLNDPMSLKQFYAVLNIIFYFTLFFVLQENVFHNSPYKSFYALLPGDLATRGKGLMGHPLILSSFVCFYHAVLLSKAFILKKWDIFNFVLIIPLIVLSASKTALIIVAISWVVYFLLSQSYKRILSYIAVAGVAAIAFFVFPTFEKIISKQIDRVANSNVNQRIGSYSVATQIFENNIFGIGMSRDALRQELGGAGSYQLNSNYDFKFLIFDNAYLTALTSYGVLGFVLFLVYFQPLAAIWKYRRRANLKPHVYSVLLFFLILMIQNISFDSYFYFPINSFYFLVLALIIREVFAVNKLSALVNHYQNMQTDTDEIEPETDII